jgi:hypothetical protein
MSVNSWLMDVVHILLLAGVGILLHKHGVKFDLNLRAWRNGDKKKEK